MTDANNDNDFLTNPIRYSSILFVNFIVISVQLIYAQASVRVSEQLLLLRSVIIFHMFLNIKLIVTGQTAVHVAATSGHIQSLQTLVYYGANVNARVSIYSYC